MKNIQQLNYQFSSQASRAVNISLTLRNWFIGGYIHQYKQQREVKLDRDKKIINRLSKQLKKMNISRTEGHELRYYQQFYEYYPQVGESLPTQLQNKYIQIPATKLETQTSISGKLLINKLSFSHIAELLRIKDKTKRAFYEIECIQGHWTVRELKRQINSLYYERSGLSCNKEKLAELSNQLAEKTTPKLTIRDPYIFEFLGLKPQEVMSESHLEDQLLTNIEDFLLELGHGFCFEARQKRILIGETYYFIDLVFYHRILKCHVLIDLKLAAFSHENIGQLNTYVHWYKKNMMTKDDNPPIGILLCTEKDHALIEYALAGMDNQLFVSKYQLKLPKKEQLQQFIEAKLQNLI